MVHHAQGQQRLEPNRRTIPVLIGAAQGLQEEELVLPISGAQPPVNDQGMEVAGEPARFHSYIDSH